MEETRAAARINTRFCVAVDGVDPEVTPRAGNISATGVYFESERDIGSVGTVHWLHVASADQASWMSVMACVARVIELVEGGRHLRGVAFQFMPLSDDQAEKLQDFVRYVLASAPDEGPEAATVDQRLEAKAVSEAPPALPPMPEVPADAIVSRLSVRTLVLDTTWPVEEGATVRVEIAAPGLAQALALKGRAVRVRTTSMIESDPRYQIELRVHDERGTTPRALTAAPPAPSGGSVRPGGSVSPGGSGRPPATPGSVVPPPPPMPKGTGSVRPPGSVPPDRGSAAQPVDAAVSETLDQLFSSIIARPVEAPAPAHKHLSGSLDRIRLPTLFALAEMERMSGALDVKQGAHLARLFLREGRILDVEPIPEGSTHRAELSRLCAWDNGTFEFAMDVIDRPDRVGVPTTALLLDLAREADEADRDDEEPVFAEGDTI
jgi:hypothetical protein